MMGAVQKWRHYFEGVLSIVSVSVSHIKAAGVDMWDMWDVICEGSIRKQEAGCSLQPLTFVSSGIGRWKRKGRAGHSPGIIYFYSMHCASPLILILFFWKNKTNEYCQKEKLDPNWKRDQDRQWCSMAVLCCCVLVSSVHVREDLLYLCSVYVCRPRPRPLGAD